MVQVTLDLSKYNDLGPRMKDVSRRGLQLIALDMQRTVDKLSPIDEGVLHKWFIAEMSDTQAVIKSPAKYVGFVNYGTGPIRVKNAKALHWSKGGSEFFAKSTKGQKGQHFVERAITAVNPRLDDHMKTAISEVLG